MTTGEAACVCLCVRTCVSAHAGERVIEGERERAQPFVGELACVGAEVMHSLGNPILLNLWITPSLQLKVGEIFIRY